MRALVALSVVCVVALGSSPDALALGKKPSRLQRTGHVQVARTSLQRATSLVTKAASSRFHAARRRGAPAPKTLLSALEADIVARINAQRGARGLRPVRVSRGLTAAADYHSRQMGLFGFFEHESRNGAPFWRRIDRFYSSGRGYWSVGENLFWESPETNGSSAVREWMQSPPHRQNILAAAWREVGVAAVHFATAPGAFGGREVTIVTADFGVRR